MKRVAAVVVSVLSGVASLSVLGTSLAAGQNKAAVGTWALYVPSEIAWRAGPESLPPGAKMAVLEGDPAKEGFFTIRLLLPDGYRVAPHWHPKVERLTIISGTVNLGRGSIRCGSDEGTPGRHIQLHASEDDALRVNDGRDRAATQQHRSLASHLR